MGSDRDALKLVRRVLDPDPPMPRPRDSMRDRALEVIDAALAAPSPQADNPALNVASAAIADAYHSGVISERAFRWLDARFKLICQAGEEESK